MFMAPRRALFLRLAACTALSVLYKPSAGDPPASQTDPVPTRAGLFSLMRFVAFCGMTRCRMSEGPTASTKIRLQAMVASSSRDGYSAVNRQDLTCDHARIVTGEIKRHVGDIVGLDQAEQMRVGKLGQCGVSGN